MAYLQETKQGWLLKVTLNRRVYVEQPPGFVDPKFSNHVYILDKALYGLKQALRAWYETLAQFLLESGFNRGIIDKTLFYLNHGNDLLLVQIYVDDIIFGSTNAKLCERFAKLMQSRYQMSMMGKLSYFQGLQVKQNEEGTFINQSKYTRNLLKKFEMQDYSTASTPMAIATKLDKDTGAPVDITIYRDKWVNMRKSVRERSIPLEPSKCDKIKVGDLVLCYRFVAKKLDKRVSNLGVVAIIERGLRDDQHPSGKLCAQILWMKNQLLDYGLEFSKIPIYCDNQSAIAMTGNPVQHSMIKHISIRYHFIREHVMEGTVELHFVPTDQQLADIFTKPLCEATFARLVNELGMVSGSFSKSA
ncbi:hypothetical protein AgCh_018062 [Apium graveolens]